MIDHYDWAGGREAMLRFGPSRGPVLVVAPALFEEANRTRAFLASVLRRLAGQGIASVLPDMPGQGESILPTSEARLEHWRAAFSAAVKMVGGDPLVLAIRGGALIDSDAVARGRYHFDPVAGAVLVRDLMRTRRIGLLAADAPLVVDDPREPGPPIMLAGNLIDRALLAALRDAKPSAADRTTMLFPAPEFVYPVLKAGHPVALWRSAEPGNDPELAEALANDILGWLRTCGG